MNLAEFSIKRPVFAWILMFGLIFFGYISFTKMGINQNPDVDFPSVTIKYQYNGFTGPTLTYVYYVFKTGPSGFVKETDPEFIEGPIWE